ncbi:MAG: GTPase RsgA [Erysipelotrichaceae bacterium]|nr:GTPase RsgA [Erysipelotrichaceae bacterium]
MTNKNCQGCGAPLQNTDINKIGYVVDLNHEICRRCFRLKHYGDASVIKKDEVILRDLLSELKNVEGTLVLLIDLLNYDVRILDMMETHFKDRPLILCITKSDLLPETLSREKIKRMVNLSLASRKIDHLMVAVTSLKSKPSIENLKRMLSRTRGNLIFIGMANAGKSSLINAITDSNALTVSAFPHTTLKINKVDFEGRNLYDTPGFKLQGYLEKLSLKDASDYAVLKPLKAKTYQISETQTYIIAPFIVLTITPSEPMSVTFYLSQTCPFHRSGKHAVDYLEKHHPEMVKMKSEIRYNKLDESTDVVFSGLGWMSLKGKAESIIIQTELKSEITLRKALL